MNMDLTTYKLRFPKQLTAEAVLQVLLNIAGQSTTSALPVRLSTRSQSGRLDHFLAVPRSRTALIGQLQAQLPGLEATLVDDALPALPYVWKLWQSTSRRPLRTDREALTTRALLISMLGAGSREALELHWLLGPVRRPLSVGSKHSGILSESWSRALLSAAFVPPGDLDSEARKALRDKLSEPAWRVQGLLAVGAADRQRAQQLASHLMAAIRTSEGPGVQLGVRRSSPKALVRQPWRWPLHLNALELTALVGWPIEEAAAGLPVAVQTHRQLEPLKPAAAGRLLGYSPRKVPVTLSRPDSLKHLHVMGPSGTGKSTLLLRVILQDIS